MCCEFWDAVLLSMVVKSDYFHFYILLGSSNQSDRSSLIFLTIKVFQPADPHKVLVDVHHTYWGWWVKLMERENRDDIRVCCWTASVLIPSDEEDIHVNSVQIWNEHRTVFRFIAAVFWRYKSIVPWRNYPLNQEWDLFLVSAVFRASMWHNSQEQKVSLYRIGFECELIPRSLISALEWIEEELGQCTPYLIQQQAISFAFKGSSGWCCSKGWVKWVS